MNKPRVSELSRKYGEPSVKVPEVQSELLEAFEDEYYRDDPEGAKRDIARLALNESAQESDT
ncbi:MAG TPA: hypothetical protein VJ841_00355 [Candidatus Saccharimonadales bacterium]|nr:hypothetical protein [Candidatus Saccharimonadales bacterium]